MEETVEEWFLSYSEDVKSFLVYFLGRLDVDDLVQETFLRAIKGFSSFKGTSSPRTWLLSIARNAAIDTLRVQNRHHTASDDALLELPSYQRSPEDIAILSDQLKDILETLQSLKPKYRQVLLLRHFMDLSPSETAKVLGWTKTRVNVTYHRGIRLMRSIWLSEGRMLDELS